MVLFTRFLRTISSNGRPIKSVTPSVYAPSTSVWAVSAEIMMTGISLIQPFLFMMSRTSMPSFSGITISRSTSEISEVFSRRSINASFPFSASIISYLSLSMSDNRALFIATSSTTKIRGRFSSITHSFQTQIQYILNVYNFTN